MEIDTVELTKELALQFVYDNCIQQCLTLLSNTHLTHLRETESKAKEDWYKNN